MSDDTYNGWANWDTWNAALWLSNDEVTYKALIRKLETTPDSYHDDVCKDALRGCFPAGDARRDGSAWDGIDFDEVDWQAVADSFTADMEA